MDLKKVEFSSITFLGLIELGACSGCSTNLPLPWSFSCLSDRLEGSFSIFVSLYFSLTLNLSSFVSFSLFYYHSASLPRFLSSFFCCIHRFTLLQLDFDLSEPLLIAIYGEEQYLIFLRLFSTFSSQDLDDHKKKSFQAASLQKMMFSQFSCILVTFW